MCFADRLRNTGKERTGSAERKCIRERERNQRRDRVDSTRIYP